MADNDSTTYQNIRDKWIRKHQDLQEVFWAKHGDVINDFVNNTKNFAIGSVSALMLLSGPAVNLLAPPHSLVPKAQEEKLPVDPDLIGVNKSVFLVSDLSNIIPKEVRPLTAGEEQSVSAVLARDFGLPVSAELSGIRLNRSYGYIGLEQHLMRYPGDTIETHFNNVSDALEFQGSGMAPGLGGWGYFANSRDTMTQKEVNREKYYIAVPTFLAPGFAEHTGEYISFFKFRKMLVVNPQNGRTIVADIGDAGPAEFTGKHLGGSPEVMKYLERVDGAQKGPVLYFFIDDPGDKVPLGPIETK